MPDLQWVVVPRIYRNLEPELSESQTAEVIDEIIANLGRVLRAYPEWPSWPRSLRQILVLAPAYGSGDTGLLQMADAHGWDVEEIKTLIDSNTDFREALDDLWRDGQFWHAGPLEAISRDGLWRGRRYRRPMHLK